MTCPCKPVSYPFRCPVHNVVKTKHWIHLCQTRPDYKKLWDDGEGPGQNVVIITRLKRSLLKLDALVRKGGCRTCKGSKVASQQEQLLSEIIDGTGVGSQLWNLFTKLGIQHRPDCSCVILADILNGLGPDGCRERRGQILKLMYKNQAKYGWSDYLKAGANMVISGWIFKINPVDPLPGFLDKAIELAEQSQ